MAGFTKELRFILMSKLGILSTVLGNSCTLLELALYDIIILDGALEEVGSLVRLAYIESNGMNKLEVVLLLLSIRSTLYECTQTLYLSLPLADHSLCSTTGVSFEPIASHNMAVGGRSLLPLEFGLTATRSSDA